MDFVTQLRMKEMELLAQRAMIDDALREIRAGLQVANAMTEAAKSEPKEEPKE